MPDKVRTAEMSWREVEEALNRGAAVLAPLGSTEEHGPHSPTGDYIVTEAICERVAKASGDVVAPIIPFGYSEYFRAYPGTVTFRAETMRMVVEDTLTSFLDQGFRHVIIVNGHSGNNPILQEVIRAFRRTRGVVVPIIPSLTFGVTGDLMKELYGDNPVGHGAEPMGSRWSYLRPDLIDLARAEDHGKTPFLGQSSVDLNGVVFNGTKVLMPVNMEDITPPSGSLSDPRLASAERGERLIETTIAAMIEFVEWFKSVDPQVDR